MLTQPLTRPLTRKIHRAQLTSIRYRDFDPLSLEPYLLFDAESSMLGNLENPTLDLDASDNGSLDVITATRAGIATFTAADGQIVNADENTVRVDHVQGEELTPTKYQRVLNTSIGSPNSQAGATLSQVTGLLGEQDGIRVTEIVTTEPHYGAIKADVVSGKTYTISFYIKQGSYSTVKVYTQSAFIVYNTNINFDAETASNNASIENAGGGWYRIITSAQTALQSGTMSIYATVNDLSTYTGDVNNFTDYYGFQVEEGTTATDFVPNTTGSPKFIASATYGPRVPMMLIEPSATNLVPYSEDFTQSSWVKNDVDVSAAPVAAPDGTMTAAHVSVTGSNPHLVDLEVVQANTHTVSIWARTVSGSGTCYFNANSTGALQTVTDQWQRFEVPANNIHAYAVDFRGSSTLTEIYIWGAQAELGSVATSYIPTSGTTVTRQSDNLVIDGTAFSDFYNATEGTFYMELIDKFNYDLISHLYLHGGGNNLIFYSNSGSSNIANYDGANFLQFTGIPSNQLVRMALSYASSTKKLSVNGNTTSDSTYNGNYAGISSLTLGTNLAGHIKRLLYWPTSSDSL